MAAEVACNAWILAVATCTALETHASKLDFIAAAKASPSLRSSSSRRNRADSSRYLAYSGSAFLTRRRVRSSFFPRELELLLEELDDDRAGRLSLNIAAVEVVLVRREDGPALGVLDGHPQVIVFVVEVHA